jgi:hypothetical protein
MHVKNNRNEFCAILNYYRLSKAKKDKQEQMKRLMQLPSWQELRMAFIFQDF